MKLHLGPWLLDLHERTANNRDGMLVHFPTSADWRVIHDGAERIRPDLKHRFFSSLESLWSIASLVTNGGSKFTTSTSVEFLLMALGGFSQLNTENALCAMKDFDLIVALVKLGDVQDGYPRLIFDCAQTNDVDSCEGVAIVRDMSPLERAFWRVFIRAELDSRDAAIRTYHLSRRRPHNAGVRMNTI